MCNFTPKGYTSHEDHCQNCGLSPRLLEGSGSLDLDARARLNAALSDLFEGVVTAFYVSGDGVTEVERFFWGTETGSEAFRRGQYPIYCNLSSSPAGRCATFYRTADQSEVRRGESVSREKRVKPATGPDAALAYHAIYERGHKETGDHWATVLDKVNAALIRAGRAPIKSVTTLKTHLDR